jgi:hypothetical protein
MYRLSDQQIDYILNDIGARGVEMESLQQNLLDHVCCIIENNLETNGDFENFYKQTIKTFYKDALWEIEEETLLLLTYKNYYAMKKIMITSGAIAATAFITGSIFKMMHWPGSSPLILLAMFCSSFIFLPLYFLFKTRETEDKANKILIAIGTANGILFCISSLFRLMHWPGNQILWLLTIGMMGLVFIPLYFFNGIKKPENKTNTITTTIILIIVAGFFFALTSLKSSKHVYISKSYHYLQNEELIARMKLEKKDSAYQNKELIALSAEIDNDCEKIKGIVIMEELGQTTIPKDFESKNLWLEECGLNSSFIPGEVGFNLVVDLKNKINQYNTLVKDASKQIPIENSLVKMTDDKILGFSNYNLLNHLTQIQLFILKNEI